MSDDAAPPRPAHEIAAACKRRCGLGPERRRGSARPHLRRRHPARRLHRPTVTRALDEADAVDARVAAGSALPLAGVPYAVKNLFDIDGVVTRAGSLINRDDR